MPNTHENPPISRLSLPHYASSYCASARIWPRTTIPRSPGPTFRPSASIPIVHPPTKPSLLLLRHELEQHPPKHRHKPWARPKQRRRPPRRQPGEAAPATVPCRSERTSDPQLFVLRPSLVDQDATEHEIKREYRKLAVVHHPDKNIGDSEAENRFKDLQEAHETLVDAEKRERYDSGVDLMEPGEGFGGGFPGGMGGMGGGVQIDPEVLFNMMGGGGRGGGGLV